MDVPILMKLSTVNGCTNTDETFHS